MSTDKNINAFPQLECQTEAVNKLTDLIEMPIRGIKKLIIISFGSNGLTYLLRRFQVQILLKKKLGGRVMYFDRDKINYYNVSPDELFEQVFREYDPKVIIIDDFQLYYEYTKLWNRILDVIAKSNKKDLLIIAGMNEERLYEKDSINKICDEFHTIATIERPTTKEVVHISESILTDYNPISDLKYLLNLDVKALVNEIEREAGYPEKVSYK